MAGAGQADGPCGVLPGGTSDIASASRSVLVNTGATGTRAADGIVVVIGHLRVGLRPGRPGPPGPSDDDSPHRQPDRIAAQRHMELPQRHGTLTEENAGSPTRSSWQPRLTFRRLDAERPVLSALKLRPPGSVSRQAWFRCVVIGCAGRLKERPHEGPGASASRRVWVSSLASSPSTPSEMVPVCVMASRPPNAALPAFPRAVSPMTDPSRQHASPHGPRPPEGAQS